MVRSSRALRGRGIQTSLNCVTLPRARRGQLVATLTGLPGLRGRSLVQGFVPDGVHRVVVTSGEGHTVKTPVVINAYAVAVTEPHVVSFRLRDQHFHVAVGYPRSGQL